MYFLIFSFFQAVQLASSIGNGGNNLASENLTLNLSFGANEMRTVVILPPELLEEIDRNSASKSPLIYAVVVGESLSLDSSRNTSQVRSITFYNIRPLQQFR